MYHAPDPTPTALHSMSQSSEQEQNEWRDLTAFVEKVLGTGQVTRTAAVISSLAFGGNNLYNLYGMTWEYLEQQPRMPCSMQAKLIKQLLEAGDAESMQQLVNNGAISADDVNAMLEATDPFKYDRMIILPEYLAAALQEQEDTLPLANAECWRANYHKAEDFTKQLLDSGIVNRMAAELAWGNFESVNHHNLAVLFHNHWKRLPWQRADYRKQAMKLVYRHNPRWN